ncbi:glycosyltransferase [Aquirufa antheringensis]|uniref:glycosyltransferase n=1 Tax=Aquirufa antheringensis TaxID=2516559 RepID=UPI00208EF099|nr:glycosyltransferase [Aquirufa antheringensis]USQ03341.1 glycosyltransferase family 4 protein [Aquirufa antheringensis]
MRIVLFDYNVEGHHFTYINLISLALYNHGYDVTILSPCTDLNKYTLQENSRVKIIPITNYPIKPDKFNFFSTRNYVINLWRSTAKELDALKLNHEKDLIFFPSIDEYITAYIPLYIVEKIFKYRWVGLYIKPRYLRVKQKYSQLRKGILNINYLLKLKTCKNIAVLDPGVTENLKKILPSKNIVFLPDVISEDTPDNSIKEYQQIINLSSGRKIVLLIGAIDRRKGLINFIEASKMMDPSKYFFVVAGKIYKNTFSSLEQNYLEELQQGVNNLYFFSQNIPSEANFNALITLCDILFASYLDFPYSSNMIGKAAFFKKHIIVSKGYLMQELVEEYDLGIAVDNDISDLINAIEILSVKPTNEMGISNYLEEYSLSKFSHSLKELVGDFL